MKTRSVSSLLLAGLLAAVPMVEAAARPVVGPAGRPAVARIAATRRAVASAELTRMRTAGSVSQFTVAQRPSVLKASLAARLAIDSPEAALTAINARLGKSEEETFRDVVTKPIVRDADGRLRATVLKVTPNSQAFTEYSTYWRPAETGLEILTESGEEGELAVGFRCAPNVKCVEVITRYHVNAVTNQETSRMRVDVAGYYYVAAPVSAVEGLFKALDTAYTYLQTHP